MPKLKPKKLVFAILITIVVAIAGFAAHLYNSHKIPKNYVEVTHYVDTSKDLLKCGANGPQCGVCGYSGEGKIINGKCYVPKGSAMDGL